MEKCGDNTKSIAVIFSPYFVTISFYCGIIMSL